MMMWLHVCTVYVYMWTTVFVKIKMYTETVIRDVNNILLKNVINNANVNLNKITIEPLELWLYVVKQDKNFNFKDFKV